MVSIIITAYNVADYIKQSINSALNQTFNDKEIIVVLDKPTDGTDKIVKEFNKSLKKSGNEIKIVENKENVGAGLARRIGIANATGEYILLLDGDDWLEPQFIENLYNKAVETDADIVSGGVSIREPSGYYEIQCYGDCVTEGYDKIVKYWGQKTVFMNNRLIRKTLCDKVPYSHRRYIEDTPTIIPMLWYANKVVYVDEVGYNYRVNADSLTHTSDFVKEFVYKGLCYCDLVEFFNANDPGLYQHLDIRDYAKTIITQMNTHKFTAQELQPYASEYAEFMYRFWDLVEVNGIAYKMPMK